jgi:hypothetical protein
MTIDVGGNSGMRDRLIEGILERIRGHHETGDADVILCAEAEWEAVALTGPNTGVDVEAYEAAGELFWLRHRARGHGDRTDDLTAALRLYAAVLDASGPERVPAPIRRVLEERDGR